MIHFQVGLSKLYFFQVACDLARCLAAALFHDIRYDICEVSASCISWKKKTWDSHIAAVVWPSSLHGCRF